MPDETGGENMKGRIYLLGATVAVISSLLLQLLAPAPTVAVDLPAHLPQSPSGHNNDRAQRHVVRINDTDLRGRSLHSVVGDAWRLEDYGSYYWLELDEAQYRQLRQSGVHFEEYPDHGIVEISNYRFDPLIDGIPAVAAGLSRAMPQTAAGYSLQLVQLYGPTTDKALAQIQDIGVALQYIPNFTYLVWAPSNATAALQKTGNVRWVGPYYSDFRITPAWLCALQQKGNDSFASSFGPRRWNAPDH